MSFRGQSRLRVVLALSAVAAILLLSVPFILVASVPGRVFSQEIADASQICASLFSVLALIGVAGSLLYQARQSRLAAHQLTRTNQRELFVLAMQDPTLLPCFAPPGRPMSEQRFKQIGFANLILAGIYSSYALGEFSEAGLRHELVSHFRSEIARQHWEIRGDYWAEEAEHSGKRTGQSFVRIANQAYREAVSEGPSVAPSQYFTPE
ncbi:DUF6082 family protein [Streptomyces sp. NPDC047525]|uniref:DUF6082 family protein n=1 Tax=Streptomyces sp. NPDC047525 TaxID=3155264 RepID=UPI0033EE817E